MHTGWDVHGGSDGHFLVWLKYAEVVYGHAKTRCLRQCQVVQDFVLSAVSVKCIAAPTELYYIKKMFRDLFMYSKDM